MLDGLQVGRLRRIQHLPCSGACMLCPVVTACAGTRGCSAHRVAQQARVGAMRPCPICAAVRVLTRANQEHCGDVVQPGREEGGGNPSHGKRARRGMQVTAGTRGPATGHCWAGSVYAVLRHGTAC